MALAVPSVEPNEPTNPAALEVKGKDPSVRLFRNYINTLAKQMVNDSSREALSSQDPLAQLVISSLKSRRLPKGVDRNEIQVLVDGLLHGETGSDTFVSLAKKVRLAEICLPNLRADFNRGLRLIGSDRSVAPQPKDLTFEQIEDALLKNKAEGLLKAAAMQEGGELFGIDENGKFLFKDRGTEPVRFGLDKDEKPVMIYYRDLAQAQLLRYANYNEIYEAVYGPEGKPTGYELFPDAPDYQKTGMVAAVEEITGAPFVRSANGAEYRSSWLDNGRVPEKHADLRYVGYTTDSYLRRNPGGRGTRIRAFSVRNGDALPSAIRLLRVPLKIEPRE